MINDLRIAKNLPVLGNVNPLLYKAWESNRNIFKGTFIFPNASMAKL
jgi:hypothetical protein